MKRLLALAAGATLLVVTGASCGAGGDDKLRRIDDADLFGLDETTTSTTSSTTSTPPSVQPTPVASSTTVIAGESVQLYFLGGNQLQPVTVDLAAPATPSQVTAALLSGPPAGALGIGLRTLLPAPVGTDPPLVTSVVPSAAGYATVDLSARTFGLIDPADQRAAIAQIVLTLVNRPGIGQVRFTLDGRPVGVPRKDGLLSEPGEAVSLQDYESLLSDATPTPTTSTTTTVPTPPTAPPGT